jgi:TP901 family phage tail tape measure protein
VAQAAGEWAMTDRKVSITVEAKDRTKEELRKTRSELDKTKKSAAAARKVMEARSALGVRPYKEIRDEITKLRGSYDTLKKSGTLSSAELYQAKAKLKQKTAELRRETGDWAGELRKARGGLIALAGAGYALIKSFNRYSEFSQRMAEVNTLIDVSKEQFASLGDEIRAMTKEIPQSAAELAAAQYDILSAGVALEKSVGVLEKSAKAAVAGVTDTKTAANAGIAVINAYGKSIDELDETYDILFKTVKLGVTTFPQLAHSIGEVLPTAKAADVDFKDLSASIATLTKAGIRTPQAMTALKGAINAMAAPAPEAKKKFDELGITWQGLIPTLDAIRKKSLSIDQMRLLIPDVEARTGVLALTQNFDVLVNTLEEMADASGAMAEAYDKMKDTPENQMKLFRNEIDRLMISAGALVSKGLLPLARGLRALIDSFRETDPVTKSIIGTLAAAAGAFAIWKLGLGSMVLGLKGFIVQARAAQIATASLTTQFTAAGIAMKASLAASVLYTAYQLAMLGKEIYGLIQAQKAARESQDRLRENSDRLMRKYEEFKDVKLPDDITQLAQEDLEDFRKRLAKARAYYTALKAKLEEEGADKELAKVNARLREIQTDFKRVGEAASGAAGEMEKPVKVLEATTEQLDEFEKKAKKAYDEAKKQAADYAKQVIAWEDKIKYARLSTEDKLRELGRRGLEDAEIWADKKLQAEEKLYAAREAMARGDYDLAEKLARDAEGLYADLATEVKKTEGGTEIVIKSLEDTKQVAINGVTEVGNFVEELYSLQRDAAASARDEWTATADGIKRQLDEIAKQREANVRITLSGLEAAKEDLRKLTQAATKHITIVTHHVDAKKSGGIMGDAARGLKAVTGRLLGGYGGGDKINAWLEPGEGVVRKEAIRKYGAAFFHAYNEMRLNAADILRAKLSGLTSSIRLPSQGATQFAFQGGGIAQAGETMTIRFQAGGAEMPLTVMGDRKVTRTMVKEFEAELIKMGLSKR